MNFASDNAGPVHPNVMAALARANDGYAASYGADTLTQSVQANIREIFEAPEAAVHLVATGTAANSIALACMSKPWQTIYCSDVAHIFEDECGAPEFFTAGSKLTLMPHENGKFTADQLREKIEISSPDFVHGVQRGPVSITQTTEKGTVFSLDELTAITDVARHYDVPVHMDGARFANALVHLGCSAADMTWKAGVDALSFGGTKNGLMGVEAVVLFDPKLSWEFELRRKRSAHLFSKHRFLSAQMDSYLTDDLWLDLARASNAACARLERGLKQMPDVKMLFERQSNMIFAQWPRSGHQRLHEAGAHYYMSGGGLEGAPDEILGARLVCDWSCSEDAVDTFLSILRD